MCRHLEATYDPVSPSILQFLGLNASEVNLALPDMLADGLLENGEPVEENVRDVVPITFLPWDTSLAQWRLMTQMRYITMLIQCLLPH
jgi:hypothetical protein